MTLLKFNPVCGLNKDDYARNKRTLRIEYSLLSDNGHEHFRAYEFSFPLDILQDIGAKELASRIYSVFKQHVSRPKSE